MKSKTIGLLGGTGWSSTIGYYQLLNEKVHEHLGGFHSANVLLKSIDYHEIKSNYGKNHERVAHLLKIELKNLLNLNPDCFMICCNSLHKYYDLIKEELNPKIPIFHAVELTSEYIKEKNHQNVLLLATKFTMEDGFFACKLEEGGIRVLIPDQNERDRIQFICHSELLQNLVTEKTKDYFQNLVDKYSTLGAEAVILGCTEFPLVLNQRNSSLPIINPVYLQTSKAVEYSLQGLCLNQL